MLGLETSTRILFFTGKGGVGKTSSACAAALRLADLGRRVLLVSTDPASNLDQVLGATLNGRPQPIPAAPGLDALNINPEQTAREYRERVVGPFRGVLPDSAISSMEEQLSGACTLEIAAFDEFSRLLGESATSDYDHLVFDTAPTGHTLRLLELPAAWSSFIENNVGGTSCLGPLSGLSQQKKLYADARNALADPARTTLFLVARPDTVSLQEAERTRTELVALGVSNQRVVFNGVFRAADSSDPTARAMEERGRQALESVPTGLARLPRVEVPLLPFDLVGAPALRALMARSRPDLLPEPSSSPPVAVPGLEPLVEELVRSSRGVVMTMGKGGVGKTYLAVRLATALAARGKKVLLTTTDPAGQVEPLSPRNPHLEVTRINPRQEVLAYTAEVLETAGAALDSRGRALLEEDLRSPCTEEVAVFRAFARTVSEGQEQFVVIDRHGADRSHHPAAGRGRGLSPRGAPSARRQLRGGPGAAAPAAGS